MVHYFAWYYSRIRLISHTLFSLFLTTKRTSVMVIVMTNFNLMAMANVSGPALTTTLHGVSFAGDRISQQQVMGKVVDPEGNPLQGVTVTVKGKAAVVKTDFDGAFSIAAQRGDVLELSFIGMKPQEVLVESNETLAITMESDAVGIDEVVVIGYGVQKKVSITNAVSSIGSEEISARNSTNVTQALQGKLPGLTIVDRGGAPGSESLTARIRGVTSLNDNNPLVLIDGCPVAYPGLIRRISSRYLC